MGAAMHSTHGLELRLLWGEVRLEEHFLTPSRAKRFTVESAGGCHFAMAGAAFEAITPCSDGYAIRFTPCMKGERTRGATTVDLAALIESGEAKPDGETFTLPVGPNDLVRVDLGGIVLEAFSQYAPSQVSASRVGINFATLNLAVVLLLAFGLFLVSAANRDELTERVDDGFIVGGDRRIVYLAVKAPAARQNHFIERLEALKPRPPPPPPRPRYGSDCPYECANRDGFHPRRHFHAKSDLMLAELPVMTHVLLGPEPGLGSELVAEIRRIESGAPIAPRGRWGLGLPKGVYELLRAIMRYQRTGAWEGFDGEERAALQRAILGNPDVTAMGSEMALMGSLDRELVRQVVSSHRDEIKYCYESELARAPSFAGKLSVKFLISAYGTVASSRIENSTVGNAAVESCVARRVSSWVFPKPRGGGVAVVNYPFVFSRGGG